MFLLSGILNIVAAILFAWWSFGTINNILLLIPALLSCAIDGMFLNTELFSHFRGSSNIGYLKIKQNDLILSAQNLHLGNCNVNLRFKHGIISPAYKVYGLVNCSPLFVQAWVKQDSTKDFF